ncbi:MAG: hypothetical protein AAFY28_14815 [Actinomycetota bacterium]
MRFPYLPWGIAPYAEQHSVYIAGAINEPIVDSLFAVRLGYIAVFANADGVLHTLLPWAWSPWIATTTGLVGPVLFVSVLLRVRAPRSIVALAIAVVVFTPLMVREWHSAIHFQFWITATLILLAGVAPTQRWHRASDGVIGAVGGLAGPVALVAVPVLVSAAVVDRRWRSHRLMVAALVAVGAMFNIAVGEGREPGGPLGRVAYLTVLKSLWQPLTGPLGRDLGVDLYSWSGVVAALWWLVVLVAVAVGLWWSTTGQWRIVALGGLWAAVAMIRYSLPPAEGLLEQGFGGRYAFAGSTLIFVAIVMSNPAGRRRAIATALALAVIAQGANLSFKQGPDWSRSASAYRQATAALSIADGDVLPVDPPGCQLSPDPERQSTGFSASYEPSTQNIDVTPADADLGTATNVYVLAASATSGWEQFDPAGRQPLPRHLALQNTFPQRGWCFINLQPAPLVESVTGPTTIRLTDDHLSGLDPDTNVFVFTGQTIHHALAKRTHGLIDLHSTAD